MGSLKKLHAGILKHNIQQLRHCVDSTTIIAPVIKADAYGHGIQNLLPLLIANNITWVCVNSISEANLLEKPELNVLIQGPLLKHELSDLPQTHNYRLTVYAKEHLDWLAALNQPIKVHLKIDTGMSRQGLLPQDAIEFIQLIKNNYPLIMLEGIYTHFATAAEYPNTYYEHQKQTFKTLIGQLNEQSISPQIIHAANSATLLVDPEMHFNLVRPGLAIYGYYPSDHIKSQATVSLKPILSLSTTVASIKTIPANQCVSYECTYTTQRETKIAILPIGYSDGLRLTLSNQIEVMIHHKKAPIIGSISMNMTIIDITDIPNVQIGDEVTILNEHITAADHARICNTSTYEILCGFK